MRHLAARPAVSLTYLPGEEMAVTVHGRDELYNLMDPARPEQRQAMLDHYVPTHGAGYGEWVEKENPIAARIVPEKMFTFHMDHLGAI
jgi:hypothetical protein